MSPIVRLADAVGELVDDQAILIRERRRHALAFDARDLEAERHDQRRVDGGRGQRLQPGDQLFGDAAAPDGSLSTGSRDLVGRERSAGHGRHAARPRRAARRDRGLRRGHAAPAPERRRGIAVRRRPWIRTAPARRWREGVVVIVVAHSLRYSRSRLVCDRLTGISVPFASLIFRM